MSNSSLVSGVHRDLRMKVRDRMTFSWPIILDSYIRAILIVVLLFGNLLPTVGGRSLALIALIGVVGLLILDFLLYLPRVNPIFLVMIPLFVILTSHAWIVWPTSSYGVEKLEKFISSTLVSALAAALILSRRHAIVLFKVWVVFSLGLALVTLAGYEGDRAVGFGSNPIWLARLFECGLLLCLWFVWTGRLGLIKGLLLILPLGLAILTTGSRGPLFAVAAGAFVWILIDNKHRLRSFMLLFGFVGLAFWSINNLSFFSNSRLVELIEQGSDDASRSNFWSATYELLGSHSDGVGFGNWAEYVMPPAQFYYPHNLFLEVAFELGIVLSLFLMLFTLFFMVRIFRQARTDSLAGVSLMLLIGETVNVSVSGDLNARTFFFSLGLVVGVTVRGLK